MFNSLDYISIFVIMVISIIFVIIINQNNKLGPFKNKFIEVRIVIFFVQEIIFIILIYTIHEFLNLFHIISYLMFIVTANITFIFFYNNIREKGLVLNFRIIKWEDIHKIKKTSHSIEVIYSNDKKLKLYIFNFNLIPLKEELKKRKIEFEFLNE